MARIGRLFLTRLVQRTEPVAAPTDIAVALVEASTATDVLITAVITTTVDSGTGSDSSNIFAAASYADSGTSSDAVTSNVATPTADAGLATTSATTSATTITVDAGTASDAVTTLGASALLLVDNGAASENTITNVSLAYSGIGIGSDSTQISRAFSLTDAGTSADVIDTPASGTVLLTDAGVTSDITTISVAISYSDSNIAAAIVTTNVATVGIDASTSSEYITTDSVVAFADIGQGTDAILTAGPTVALDIFNRADGALGTADIGGAWTALAGTWAISGNRAALTPTGSGAQAIATLPTGTALPAGQLTVDIQLSAANTHAGVVLRATSLTSYMAVQLHRTTGGINQLRISKRIGAASTYWVTTTALGLVAGRGYTLAVVLSSTAVTAYLDGTSVGTYTFIAQDNTDLPGAGIGLRSWDDATNDEDGGSRWDDLIATTNTTLTPRIPAPPIAPSAAIIGATTATITWTQAGNGSTPLTSYTIQSTAGNTYTGISPSVTTYDATGLTAVSQTFTVTAVNAVGSRTSVASNAVTPTGQQITGADTGIGSDSLTTSTAVLLTQSGVGADATTVVTAGSQSITFTQLGTVQDQATVGVATRETDTATGSDILSAGDSTYPDIHTPTKVEITEILYFADIGPKVLA